MKDKPDLQDQFIIDRLGENYGIQISCVEFLPIGDISSAKYRVVSDGGISYFLKLRKNCFREVSVFVTNFLHEQGIYQVIAPLKTKGGLFCAKLNTYTCILYPFIDGHNGFQDPLSDDQWNELGRALKTVHSVTLPPDIQCKISIETYHPRWRESVKEFLVQAGNHPNEDPVATKFANGLLEHRNEIRLLIERAEELGYTLQSQSPERVLCHADIHAGNLLLEADGALHLIDWDDPMIAPKERDLMFIGGGIGGIWNTSREVALFYQGYGSIDLNLTALTYYRYERIVSDIAEFCAQILLTTEGTADRERSLQKFYSIFLPDQVLEIANQTDRILQARR